MSSPSSHHRARLGAVALMALLLLGACTGRKPDPTGYGNTTKTNFNEGCLETAKKQDTITHPDAYCTCSYNAIVDQIPFADFKKFNSDLSDNPGPLQDDLQKIADDCVKSTNS